MSEAAAQAAPTSATGPNSKDEVSQGPLSVLMYSVKNNTPILVSLRNNHKLYGHVKAFDRHCNLVMTGVKEFWTEPQRKGATGDPIQRDRRFGKLFVRGDSVIIVVKNPEGAAPSSSST